MSNFKSTINKNLLAFLLLIIITISFPYLLVYKVSFLPSGYDIVSKQENNLMLNTFSVLGVKEGMSSVSFPKSETWKIDDIAYEVGRYIENLWILFTAGSIFIFLLITKLRKGMKIKKSILLSVIVLSILMPLYLIFNSLTRIHQLLS